MGVATVSALPALPATRRARVAWAILFATIVVVVASAANFLTTAPKAISLLFEPLSLFLMPGLLVSLAVAGPHDYSLSAVVFTTLTFYTAFFYFALTWLSRRHSLR